MILIFSFDYKGVVHHEYASQGQTIKQHLYVQVSRHIHAAINDKHDKIGNLACGKFFMTMHLPIGPSSCGDFDLTHVPYVRQPHC
jgi:hypothetical protein